MHTRPNRVAEVLPMTSHAGVPEGCLRYWRLKVIRARLEMSYYILRTSRDHSSEMKRTLRAYAEDSTDGLVERSNAAFQL